MASMAQTTWLRLATSIPTTHWIWGSSMDSLLHRSSGGTAAWPLGSGHLVHRRSARGDRRSSSAIDPTHPRGRHGRLFTSVEPKGGTEPVACQPRGGGASCFPPISNIQGG